MKTHPDNESGKPRQSERLLQGIARLLLLIAALFTAGMARAQSFTPVITQVLAAEDNERAGLRPLPSPPIVPACPGAWSVPSSA